MDDDPLSSLTTVTGLEGHGYDVAEARTAAAALEAIPVVGPDIVLLDIDLGTGGDGPALAREIAAVHHCPIVFYSGHSDAETVARTRDIDHFGYVIKSAGPHVLDQTIRTALRLSRAMEAQRESEHRVRELLEERTSRFRESHRRIQTDMDLVRSMLAIQRFQSSDTATQSALYEAEQHISFLSRIYDRIDRSDHVSRIHVPDLVQDLLFDLEPGPLLSVGSAPGISHRSPRISPTVDPVSVDRAVCVPIGIILWELTSNALRHAFPVGPEDEVHVAVRARDDDWMDISVTDNGRGFPPSADPSVIAGFGLSLVHTLAEQYSGTVTVDDLRTEDAGRGTRVRVSLQIPLASTAPDQ